MQRKAIRATVGGTDTDIPIGVFAAGQYLIYQGGVISTATIAAGPTGISGPSTTVANRLATWANTTGSQLQEATITATGAALGGVSLINGIDPATWVTGVSPAQIDQVAVFNSTGANIVKASPVKIGATGAITGVQTINARDPLTWTIGPASSTDNAIARFDGASGVLLQNSVVAIDDTGAITGVASINGSTWTGDYVRGPTPATSAANNVATWTNATGRQIQDSGLPVSNIVYTTVTEAVTGHLLSYANSGGRQVVDSGIVAANVPASPGASADNAITRYDGATGKQIQTSTVTLDDSGGLSGVAAVNGTDPAAWVRGPATAAVSSIAVFNSATGKLLADGGIPVANVVRSPAGSADNAVVRWDGTTGQVVQSGVVTIDDAGVIAGATYIGGLPLSRFVKTSSVTTTPGQLAAYNATNGELIFPSGIASDFSGGLTGVTSINGADAARLIGYTAARPNPSFNSLAAFDTNSLPYTISAHTVQVDTSGNMSSVGTINGAPSYHLTNYTTGKANPFADEIACFDATSFPVTISYRPVQISTGGAITGVTTINGVQPESHMARHILGADSILQGNVNWASSDAPSFVLGGTAMEPRFRKSNLTVATAVGTSFVSPTGSNMTLAPRATQYYACEWTFPCQLADGTINIEAFATWSGGSGSVALHVGQGSASTTSGATLANSANYACVKIHLALFGAPAFTVINAGLRKATGSMTVRDGSLIVIQTT